MSDVIKACFFDLDGTLQDSEVLYVDAVRIALLWEGHPISREDALELVYGRGWSDIFIDVNERFPSAYSEIEAMEEAVREIYLDLEGRRDISIPGSIALLKRLAESCPIAIVSGSPRADIARAIEILELGPCLQFFLGAEDYFPGKPNPICYLTAAARLGVGPEDCLVFEDSTAGISAAKGAGMYCVALKRKGAPEQDLRLADAVYEDLAEFSPETFLERMQG